MKNKTKTAESAQSRKNGREQKKPLGPVSNLEEHVSSDWWRKIFNATYLKTDSDVVGDKNITNQEVKLFTDVLKLSPDDKILDLCCGHGRHTIEFAKKGYKNIEGLDRSHYLIQRAKTAMNKEGLNIRFREGDARKLPYATDTFDAVLILGNSFGYFETVRDDLRVLKEVSRVLKPWGKLLVDVADGNYLKTNYKPRSWEWIGKKYFVCRERSFSLDGQRLISREIITDIDKGVIEDQFYAERLYSRESIIKLLEEASFQKAVVQSSIATSSQRNQDMGMMEQRIIISAEMRKEWSMSLPFKENVGKKLKNVTVILGDPSKPDPLKPFCVFDEDDFYTIDRMKSALKELTGYQFRYFNNHNTLIYDLLKEKGKIDLVFNLCDEGYNNEPRKELHVPALLEKLEIPYTGSGPQCLAYCYDKSLVRGIASEMSIPVPQALFIKPEDSTFGMAFKFPVIVKPNFGDSSFGITQNSVVNNLENLIAAISEIREKFGYEKPILVEEFLTGSDITVGVVGNPPESYTVFPIIEEDYSELPEHLPRICGYEAKWRPDSPYWKLKSVPANLSDDTKKSIEEWCVKLSERLECRDYARFDWRLDAEGQPKLLEVNPNPGWCWDGHLAKMAKLAGYSYAEMLKIILEAAAKRIENVRINVQ